MAPDTLGIRDYRAGDAEITLALFRRAVREVAARDYTPAQIEAWAGGIDRTLWDITLARQSTWLAMIDDAPAGFASFNEHGHLDMLFVSPDHQRRGVASALLNVVEQAAQRRGITRVTTEASLTGRPFFEVRGFDVVTRQTMKRCGEVLKNFRMEKVLHDTGATA